MACKDKLKPYMDNIGGCQSDSKETQEMRNKVTDIYEYEKGSKAILLQWTMLWTIMHQWTELGTGVNLRKRLGTNGIHWRVQGENQCQPKRARLRRYSVDPWHKAELVARFVGGSVVL